MNRPLPASVAILGASLSLAQAPALASTDNATPRADASTLDARSIEQKMNESFYHPAEVESFECRVVPEWNTYYRMDKLTPGHEEEALKILQATKISVLSEADKKSAVVKVDWPHNASLFDKAIRKNIESQIQQSMSGFFQLYWGAFDTTPTPASTKMSAEALPDGNYKLVFDAVEEKMDVILSREYRLVTLSSKSKLRDQTVKATYYFVESPNSTEGDRFRFVGEDIYQTVGGNVLTVTYRFTYQDVNGAHIPKVVHFTVPVLVDSEFAMNNCKVKLRKN